MSDKDRTTRPPDQSDRTIMVPNPRRRRAPTSFDVTPPPSGVPGPLDDWAPAPPGRPAATGSAALNEAVPILVQRRLLEAPNENAILRAAAPLLLTLGGLRVALVKAPVAELMQEVADAVLDFEAELRPSGISAAQERAAKYILCATADDIVQNIPGDQNMWTQYSMLSRFFGERNGGITFFEILDRLKMDPAPNCDILELQHACLTLGFQGMHRTAGGSTAALQQVQRNLYETIRRIRRPDVALSPHWEGQPIAAYADRFRLPLWTIAAFVGVLLFGLYLILRMILGNATAATVQTAGTLHPAAEIAIQRRVFAPPPPPPQPTKPQQLQLARVKAALAAELAGQKLAVQQTGDEIIVRLANISLFASADAQVNKAFDPLATKITAMLEKEVGYVKVAGFTDNSPIKTLKFTSNYELSLARAKAVAALLKPGMAKPDRLQIAGRGADHPIGNNDTKDGRAANRRVEISIPRVD